MVSVNTLERPTNIDTNNTQNMSTATLSILIVEDDLSFALELDMLVREIGYNVIGRVGQLYTIKDNNGYNRQINIKGKFSVGSNDGNRNLYSIFKLV